MCSINNQVINRSAVAQLLIPVAFYSIGRYCMHRINIPWKQVIENSAVKARSLNRLRITTCCIGISGALQVTSRMSKLSNSPQTDNIWMLNAGSMALFGYLIVTEKVHHLITYFIFGTQIIISNIYIKERPLLENEIPDQQLVSSEENQNELTQNHQVNHEVLNTLIDQQEESNISIEPLPMGTNMEVGEYTTEEQIHQLPTIANSFIYQRPISTNISLQGNRNEIPDQQQDSKISMHSQEWLIDSELEEIHENLKRISKSQEQDEYSINEYIDACKNCLERLHETDRKYHKGFNPINELAEQLRLYWGNFITLLPRTSQKEAFCVLIEELSRCNYFIPGKLKHHIIKEIRQPSIEKWVDENHKYFEAKSRISVMINDKEQKNEEKFLEGLAKEKTSKSYTILQKQELMNTYLLRKRQLQVANLNEVIKKHEYWYSMIYPENLYCEKHIKFLISYGFSE